MHQIDIDATTLDTLPGCPSPHNKAVEGSSHKRFGNAAGLTQYGVNLYFVLGSRHDREVAENPDIDMRFERDGKIRKFTRENGESFTS
jgi:hypothetical protein